MSDTHKVAANGKYLAMISTTVETSNPEEELKPALDLLGKIDEKFMFIADLFEPNDDGGNSKVDYKKIIELKTASTSNMPGHACNCMGKVYLTILITPFVFQIFISKSYDPTTHFETTCTDIISLYERISGESFDLNSVKREVKDDE